MGLVWSNLKEDIANQIGVQAETHFRNSGVSLIKLNGIMSVENAYYTLLEDPKTGKIKREFVNEKVLSVILELILDEDQLPEMLEILKPLFENLDTVVSLGLVSRFMDDGSIPVIKLLEESGFPVRPNAKINVGLGRPLID